MVFFLFFFPPHNHFFVANKKINKMGRSCKTNAVNAMIQKITDSKDHRVYHKKQADTGKFAFTSDDYDTYKICFSQTAPNEANPPDYDNHVAINVKLGVEAKSYEDVGKAEHLSKMEVQMRRLEDLAESIVSDFADMKRREEMHRDTNESTNDRMLWFSVFSMVCLVVLACGQVMYLKKFFKSKKLID